jgi:hypothetical protein
MNRRTLAFSLVIAMFCMVVSVANAFEKDPQQEPKRLASMGDSITEAIDAEFFGANHWASWANGYHDFWQWMFGLSNVNSHNQRITAKFGSWGRKNYMEAVSGADSFDLPEQAQGAVDHLATYVMWLMGHNDICQDHVWEITSWRDFLYNAYISLYNLSNNLPQGATVYVVGMVDVTRLYDIAKDKKALGIVDCEVLWFFTLFELFPCGTVLGPFVTEEDREVLQDIVEIYNLILQILVEHFNTNDSRHYYFYTDEVFTYEFVENQVSDIDCFHPSAIGQAELSRITWEADDGPRFQDW